MRKLFQISFRRIKGDITHSSITIFTMSIGLSICIILSHYLYFQVKHDTFFTDSSHIYRVERSVYDNHTLTYSSIKTPPALNAELDNLRITVATTRVLDRAGIVSANNKPFREDNMIHVDKGFLDVFRMNFVEGNPETVFESPNSILISDKMRAKYFDGNAVGELLTINDNESYTVAGVYKLNLANSHFAFTAILPYDVFRTNNRIYNSWNWNNVRTYIKAVPNKSVEDLSEALTLIAEANAVNISKKSERFTSFHLERLTNIHFNQLDNGSKTALRGIGILSIIILLIGWLNYFNLLGSHVAKTRVPIVTKKVLGAQSSDFLKEQLISTTIYLVSSVACSFLIVLAVLAKFNLAFEVNIELFMPHTLWLTSLVLLIYTFVILLLNIFTLSRVQGTKTSFSLSYKMISRKENRKWAPHSLIVIQYMLVISTIAAAISIKNQISYMLTTEKHFKNQNVLVLQPPGIMEEEYDKNARLFKNTARSIFNVDAVSISSSVPGQEIEDQFTGEINIGGELPPDETLFVNWCDDSFIEVYGIELLVGNSFLGTKPKVLLNQSAVILFDSSPNDLIRKTLVTPYDSVEIVGVVHNFNQSSLKDDFQPQAIIYDPEIWGYISIKFSQTIRQDDIDAIAAIWKQSFPESPFEYVPSKEFERRQYNEEFNYRNLCILLAILSILITAIGLMGYTLNHLHLNKSKYAIRKVLGSSDMNILFLISRSYIFGIILANLIALPLLVLIYQKWIETYAFSGPIKLNVFLVPSILLLVLNLISIMIYFISTVRLNLSELINHSDV